ncbi:hypothetical protein GCM10010321_42530 [Streptomyces chartreusis]|nr:hypothetical protein GCM10010321_42530 [Streptomyces chartreusis]
MIADVPQPAPVAACPASGAWTGAAAPVDGGWSVHPGRCDTESITAPSGHRNLLRAFCDPGIIPGLLTWGYARAWDAVEEARRSSRSRGPLMNWPWGSGSC